MCRWRCDGLPSLRPHLTTRSGQRIGAALPRRRAARGWARGWPPRFLVHSGALKARDEVGHAASQHHGFEHAGAAPPPPQGAQERRETKMIAPKQYRYTLPQLYHGMGAVGKQESEGVRREGLDRTGGISAWSRFNVRAPATVPG